MLHLSSPLSSWTPQSASSHKLSPSFSLCFLSTQPSMPLPGQSEFGVSRSWRWKAWSWGPLRGGGAGGGKPGREGPYGGIREGERMNSSCTVASYILSYEWLGPIDACRVLHSSNGSRSNTLPTRYKKWMANRLADCLYLINRDSENLYIFPPIPTALPLPYIRKGKGERGRKLGALGEQQQWMIVHAEALWG